MINMLCEQLKHVIYETYRYTVIDYLRGLTECWWRPCKNEKAVKNFVDNLHTASVHRLLLPTATFKMLTQNKFLFSENVYKMDNFLKYLTKSNWWCMREKLYHTAINRSGSKYALLAAMCTLIMYVGTCKNVRRFWIRKLPHYTNYIIYIIYTGVVLNPVESRRIQSNNKQNTINYNRRLVQLLRIISFSKS